MANMRSISGWYQVFGVLIQIAEFNPNDWLSDDVKLNKDEKFQIMKNDKGCSLILSHPGGGKTTLDLTKKEMETLRDALKT